MRDPLLHTDSSLLNQLFCLRQERNVHSSTVQYSTELKFLFIFASRIASLIKLVFCNWIIRQLMLLRIKSIYEGGRENTEAPSFFSVADQGMINFFPFPRPPIASLRPRRTPIPYHQLKSSWLFPVQIFTLIRYQLSIGGHIKQLWGQSFSIQIHLTLRRMWTYSVRGNRVYRFVCRRQLFAGHVPSERDRSLDPEVHLEVRRETDAVWVCLRSRRMWTSRNQQRIYVDGEVPVCHSLCRQDKSTSKRQVCPTDYLEGYQSKTIFGLPLDLG